MFLPRFIPISAWIRRVRYEISLKIESDAYCHLVARLPFRPIVADAWLRRCIERTYRHSHDYPGWPLVLGLSLGGLLSKIWAAAKCAALYASQWIRLDASGFILPGCESE